MADKIYIKIESRGFEIFVYENRKGEHKIKFEKYYPFKKGKREITYAINEVCYEICDRIKIVQESFKLSSMVCIIQTADIMIREIEVLKKATIKDIKSVLNMEMKNFSNFDSKDNIIIKKSVGEVDDDFIKVRVKIFHKRNIDFIKKIESIIGIKCRGIYTDYDFSMEILKNLSINSAEEAIEIRNEDIVYTTVDKNGIKDSVIIEKESLDKEFFDFIEEKKLILIGDKENKLYKTVSSEVKEWEHFNRDVFFNIENRKNTLHNFLENTYSSNLYRKVLYCIYAVLIITVLTSAKYFISNRNLENKLENTVVRNTKEDKHKLKHIKGYKNIYGTNIEEILKLIEFGGDSVKNINADEKFIDAEFIFSDKKRIKEIMSMNKDSEVEYIKTENLSKKEAENIYGIGVDNEKSNKKTGKEKDNKKETKEKVYKNSEKKAYQNYNKKEDNKDWEKDKDKKDSKAERGKENNNKKTCKVCGWKEKSEENKKNKIKETAFYKAVKNFWSKYSESINRTYRKEEAYPLCKYRFIDDLLVKSYADDEYEDIENNIQTEENKTSENNRGQIGNREEGSVKRSVEKENKDLSSSNREKEKNGGNKEKESSEKEGKKNKSGKEDEKSEYIKLYFLKLRIYSR